MEFQFLGTSSGTPTRSRNVSGLALRPPEGTGWVLVDCGEGTQHQLLRTSLTLPGLSAIFISHVHGDHCYGLPGLLASAGMLNRTAALPVVGPAPLGRFLEGVMETTALRLPYAVEFVDVEALDRTDLIAGLAVRATALSHRVPSYAYSFTEKSVERKLDVAKLARDGVAPGPAWGQLQQGLDVAMTGGGILRAADYLLAPRNRRKVIVGGDNDQPALLAAEAVDADVLVHEATYTEAVLRKVGPAPQHSSARQVAQFAAGAGIPNLVLTHFSPRYQQEGALALADLATEAREVYGGALFLADDFDRFVLDRQGVLVKANL